MVKSNGRYNEDARNDEFMESDTEHDVAHNVFETKYNEQTELPSLDGMEGRRYHANAGSG